MSGNAVEILGVPELESDGFLSLLAQARSAASPYERRIKAERDTFNQMATASPLSPLLPLAAVFSRGREADLLEGMRQEVEREERVKKFDHDVKARYGDEALSLVDGKSYLPKTGWDFAKARKAAFANLEENGRMPLDFVKGLEKADAYFGKLDPTDADAAKTQLDGFLKSAKNKSGLYPNHDVIGREAQKIAKGFNTAEEKAAHSAALASHIEQITKNYPPEEAAKIIARLNSALSQPVTAAQAATGGGSDEDASPGGVALAPARASGPSLPGKLPTKDMLALAYLSALTGAGKTAEELRREGEHALKNRENEAAAIKKIMESHGGNKEISSNAEGISQTASQMRDEFNRLPEDSRRKVLEQLRQNGYSSIEEAAHAAAEGMFGRLTAGVDTDTEIEKKAETERKEIEGIREYLAKEHPGLASKLDRLAETKAGIDAYRNLSHTALQEKGQSAIAKDKKERHSGYQDLWAEAGKYSLSAPGLRTKLVEMFNSWKPYEEAEAFFNRETSGKKNDTQVEKERVRADGEKAAAQTRKAETLKMMNGYGVADSALANIPGWGTFVEALGGASEPDREEMIEGFVARHKIPLSLKLAEPGEFASLKGEISRLGGKSLYGANDTEGGTEADRLTVFGEQEGKHGQKFVDSINGLIYFAARNKDTLKKYDDIRKEFADEVNRLNKRASDADKKAHAGLLAQLNSAVTFVEGKVYVPQQTLAAQRPPQSGGGDPGGKAAGGEKDGDAAALLRGLSHAPAQRQTIAAANQQQVDALARLRAQGPSLSDKAQGAVNGLDDIRRGAAVGTAQAAEAAGNAVLSGLGKVTDYTKNAAEAAGQTFDASKRVASDARTALGNALVDLKRLTGGGAAESEADRQRRQLFEMLSARFPQVGNKEQLAPFVVSIYGNNEFVSGDELMRMLKSGQDIIQRGIDNGGISLG